MGVRVSALAITKAVPSLPIESKEKDSGVDSDAVNSNSDTDESDGRAADDRSDEDDEEEAQEEEAEDVDADTDVGDAAAGEPVGDHEGDYVLDEMDISDEGNGKQSSIFYAHLHFTNNDTTVTPAKSKTSNGSVSEIPTSSTSRRKWSKKRTKKLFSEAEDEQLKRFIERFGPRWATIDSAIKEEANCVLAGREQSVTRQRASRLLVKFSEKPGTKTSLPYWVQLLNAQENDKEVDRLLEEIKKEKHRLKRPLVDKEHSKPTEPPKKQEGPKETPDKMKKNPDTKKQKK